LIIESNSKKVMELKPVSVFDGELILFPNTGTGAFVITEL